ncbi:LysR family transcriptional regulator [Stenotrophomonas sp. Betaine-02u-21]|uniref:LysR family transcriptional regulator n=1 Tax=unclassified Stenotrophomonas TaxID=196198 RepID=UPI000C3435A0|nr:MULTISPECIES: LysR family transcriptional regulator [unclassified Stenotrophomonas]PKH70843.1 LysR family transcriptional regulator [Stenotrophomonas sp. Betaine-02u-23]PKH72660.1 LysR family transcriptional regulator [Stenotrophomonas sp. Betaine-02u-21]PKH97165.1 LysR family transcriptional regulator [Stenotrophomonas sp. Bg11-02]
MRGSEFAELKAFAAVVERASFARAADHLGLSRSALSQIVRQLEARLGVRLLNRTTRSVSPTEPGRRLHERIAPMLREMDDAVAQALGSTARTAGTLRINTLSMAAHKLIAPRLGRFAQAHPDVVLDIVVDDGLSDIAGEGFDAGIRVGGRLQKDMIAVRLTPDVELLAVASPDYLARHGEPKVPADLQQHACIGWRYPGSGKIAGWEFRRKGKSVEFVPEGRVLSNHQDIVVPAALQGLGILYAYNDDGIAEALRDGRLKRVLADWSPTVPGLFLYYSSRRYLLPALRAFIDCLLDRDLGQEQDIQA